MYPKQCSHNQSLSAPQLFLCVLLHCVNVQRHGRSENLRLPTCVFPLHGCVTVLHLYHYWQLKTQLCSAQLSLVEVMSGALVHRGSVNPPRRSLAHSQWQCWVFPSAPRKIHMEADPTDWSCKVKQRHCQINRWKGEL